MTDRILAAQKHVCEAFLALSCLRHALADISNPFDDGDTSPSFDTFPLDGVIHRAESALREASGFLYLCSAGEPAHVATYLKGDR